MAIKKEPVGGDNYKVNAGKSGIVKLFVCDAAALMLTVLVGTVLASVRAAASDTVQSRAAVTVSSSCQLEAEVDTAHEAEVTASTYRDNIGQTTITATCNDVNGYAVYAIGYTNTEFGRNDMLGENTGRTIATGSATSGSVSNWAMKLTAVSGAVAPTIETGYQAYHAVPDEYEKVASYGGSTVNYVAGSQFRATYATYVASDQAPDTYVGKVKYTLVHPADTTNAPCSATYTIGYNANGGTGSMDSQTGCLDTPIALLPNGFTPKAPLNEYQFGAWNTEADGSGYIYWPGQAVTNLSAPDGMVILYAMWIPRYIQDLTPGVCNAMTKENPLTMIDRRDGNDYTVRYLQNACWMTQNLRLTDTVSSQYSNFSTNPTFNPCVGDLTAGNTYDEARCHDSGSTETGVWYNYASASAGTITGSSNSTAATEDICPAGWHLPSYDTAKPAGSVNSLLDLPIKSYFSPVTGGYYNGGSIGNTGNGYWWSSIANNTTNRYYLYYNGSSLNTGGNNRDRGLYIRCVRE